MSLVHAKLNEKLAFNRHCRGPAQRAYKRYEKLQLKSPNYIISVRNSKLLCKEEATLTENEKIIRRSLEKVSFRKILAQFSPAF